LLYVILAAFLTYAVFIAIKVSTPSDDVLGLLILFLDTVFFMVVAGFGAEHFRYLSLFIYMHLLGTAVVFYGPLEVFAAVAACIIFCAAVNENTRRNLASTVVVAGLMACVNTVKKQQLTGQINRMNTQLEEARRAKDKAVEDERQRIASDFHDGPLQSFIALQMRLEVLRKLLELDIPRGLEDLKQLQGVAQSQVRDLRAFLHSMRPVDVDGANLMASARRTAENFQKESGIPVTFLGANTPVGLPPDMGREVLQLLREALHNIQKHAAATRVAVALEKTDRNLEISVDDNGRGFAFAGSYSLEELELLQLGPASLKRRARSLNAELLVESRPGHGTGLKVRVPLS
jgi:signal transduction histidine kinase